MKKWRVVKVRKDLASGKNDDRAGFQELLTDIRRQKIDVVTVYRLDRLSRNVRDIYQFLETIQDSKVGFVSVTEGFDTTTAMGRATVRRSCCLCAVDAGDDSREYQRRIDATSRSRTL